MRAARDGGKDVNSWAETEAFSFEGPGQRGGGLRSSRLAVSSFVLLRQAGGDPAAIADRDAVVARPGPDITAALTGRGCTRRPAALTTPRLTGLTDIRRDLLAERRRVLLAQIDLVLKAAEPEPYRLVRRTAGQIIFQRDRNLRRHPQPPRLPQISAP
jgi:hypothetical protein